MTELILKITGQIRKIAVRPGDVILVSIVNDLIDAETTEEIKQKVQSCFPESKVLVCGPDVEIKVMREVK